LNVEAIGETMANGNTQIAFHPLAAIPFIMNGLLLLAALLFGVLGSAALYMLSRGLPGWWQG